MSKGVDRSDANLKMLQEADDIQNKTAEAIMRIQKQTAESEDVGIKTIEELRRQAQQMDDINTELESVSGKLDHASNLQNKFDSWAGNWLGGKKRRALNEAAQEIQNHAGTIKTYVQVKEVFEQEKFDSISRTWRSAGQVLCTDPTITAKDVFDPRSQSGDVSWSVDYSLPNIDAEGWTYAYDFNALNKNPAAGESASKWNTYVRRRKWKYTEKKTSTSDAVSAVANRQNERKAKSGAGSSQAEKIGYVPRNRNPGLTASGLTVTGSTSRKAEDQDLDDASAAGLARLQAKDADIDRGIDEICNSIDRLGQIASTIRDEAKSSAVKIDMIDQRLQRANEKQTIVNARLRGQLK